MCAPSWSAGKRTGKVQFLSAAFFPPPYAKALTVALSKEVLDALGKAGAKL